MIRNVATIVTPVNTVMDQGFEKKAAQALKAMGIDQIEFQTLDNERAVDILFSGDHPNLHQKAQVSLQGLGSYDVFVQSNDEYRRKKLLLSDMDATILIGETLDDLAERLGIGDQVAPVTAAAMRGEIDFAEALRGRVKLLKGVPVSMLMEEVARVEYSTGAMTLIKTMNKFGAKCVLISGGFDVFTSHVAAVLGFYKNIANKLEAVNDHLTGELIPPMIDKWAKKTTLENETRALGIDIRATIAVGDGANDIPMLQTAGAGVGYFGKPAVQAATPHQVRYTDLTALLYMQGYKKEEFTS